MKILKFLSVLIVMVIISNSCVKQEFDKPPVDGLDPNLETNFTMAELLALRVDGSFVDLPEGKVLDAIVVADDETGNFYKTLIVQDETGGIALLFDGTSLFNEFPVGKKIYIKTDGLVVGDYRGLPQIGAGTYTDDFGNLRMSGIPSALIDDYLVPATVGHDVEPILVTLNDFAVDKMNMLVKIDDVQFISIDANQPFAEAATHTAINRNIEDCNGVSKVVRTSGYCSFASELTPAGKGSFVGILSYYSNAYQLLIREPADLDMNAPRCGGGSGEEELMTIGDLRGLFGSGTTNAPDNKKIKGIVISDYANGNIHGLSMVIQDETAGITVRFDGDHSFGLGEEVEVVVSGNTMEEYNGLLQLNCALAQGISVGSGSMEPQIVTVDELNSNLEDYESELVKIENVTISGTTFGGSHDITDNTGTIPMYVRNEASFNGAGVPSGETSITCIAVDYNGPQVSMRNGTDVTGGGSGPTAVFDDGFEGTFGNWTTYSVVGDLVWVEDVDHGNPGTCAKMSGYDGGAAANDDWIISPSIDLSSYSTASYQFQTAMNYTGNDLEVYVSDDYSGTGDPNSATWTLITAQLSSGSWDWTDSGNIDISSYAGGSVYLGFRFTCTDDSSATWELDNVKVFAE